MLTKNQDLISFLLTIKHSMQSLSKCLVCLQLGNCKI